MEKEFRAILFHPAMELVVSKSGPESGIQCIGKDRGDLKGPHRRICSVLSADADASRSQQRSCLREWDLLMARDDHTARRSGIPVSDQLALTMHTSCTQYTAIFLLEMLEAR